MKILQMALIFVAFLVVFSFFGSLVIADVIKSPAATSNITIDELVITTTTTNITIHGFHGEANSKILDLLILAAH